MVGADFFHEDTFWKFLKGRTRKDGERRWCLVHCVPESSSTVSTVLVILDAEKSSTKKSVSWYSERFLHWKNHAEGRLGDLSGFIFAWDCLLFLILELMLYTKIYGDYESHKPVESHTRLPLMHTECRKQGKKILFSFFIGNEFCEL